MQSKGNGVENPKAMMPPPYLLEEASADERRKAHKTQVRKVTAEHQYIRIDRSWARNTSFWAGHAARLAPERWASKGLNEKDVKWWREQQTLTEGRRHTRTRGNLSRWEIFLRATAPKHALWKQGAEQVALEGNV